MKLDRLLGREDSRVDDDLDSNSDSSADGSSGSGFSFDPTRIGPLDVLAAIVVWIEERALWIGGLSVVSLIGYAWLNVAYGFAISIPTWFWVGSFSLIGGAVLTAWPIRWLIEWVWTEESYVLVDQNPVDGDLAVWELSADKWSSLRVIDRSGSERSPTYLQKVRLRSGGIGYEVDGYAPDLNVCVSSWMAGASNSDIRRHERAVNLIKRQLSKEAEISVDELIDAPEAIREVGSETVHEIIRVAEGIESPTGGESVVSDKLSELVEAHEAKVSKVLDDTTVDIEDAASEENAISIDELPVDRRVEA